MRLRLTKTTVALLENGHALHALRCAVMLKDIASYIPE